MPEFIAAQARDRAAGVPDCPGAGCRCLAWAGLAASTAPHDVGKPGDHAAIPESSRAHDGQLPQPG